MHIMTHDEWVKLAATPSNTERCAVCGNVSRVIVCDDCK
jgi:hypothetical protein